MFTRRSLLGLTRAFSLHLKSSVKSTLPRIVKARDLVKELALLPDNAPLRLVNYLGGIRPNELTQALYSNPRLRQFRGVWAPVLTAPDFDNVMKALESPAVKMSQLPISKQRWQPWAYILYHIILNKPTKPEELIRALVIVDAHLPAVQPSSQPVLIVVAVARLAEEKLIAPLRRLIDRFQNLPITTEDQYNFLLRALALAPGVKDVGMLTLELLEEMARRGFKLQTEACNALLRPRFVNLDVALGIEASLKGAGADPTVQQLEALFRLMVTHGRRRDAARVLYRLRSSSVNTRLSTLPTQKDRLPRTYPVTAWDIAILGSFRNSAAAYRHLTELTQTARNSLPPVQVSANTTSEASEGPAEASQGPSLVGTEWLATLRVAARDPKVNPDRLISIFRAVSAQFAPSVNESRLSSRPHDQNHRVKINGNNGSACMYCSSKAPS